MVKRLEVTVTGDVQGVLYRAFTRKAANKLGLTGTVRNIPDKTVEVIAEGEESSLNELLWYLKKGSYFSRVQEVIPTWREATGAYPDFRIVW